MPEYKLSEQAKRCIRGEDTIAPVLDALLKREVVLPRPFFERRRRIMSELRGVLVYHRSAEAVTDRVVSHIIGKNAANITKSLITTHTGNIIESVVGRRRV